MSSPTQIAPGVFIGNQFTAADADFFRKHNIKRVVNCTPDVPFYFKGVEYMRISLNDISNVRNNHIMRANLMPAVRFINAGGPPGKANGVLIHCAAGISRSCTVGVAYLRTCCADTLPIAIAMMLSRRPIAFFNGTSINFMDALKDVFKR